jgi:hypothetical protein
VFKIRLSAKKAGPKIIKAEKALTKAVNKMIRDEILGGWRKLRNEELHNLYSSPNIIRMIMSRRMRRAGHVARMGRKGTRIAFWEF